MFEKQKVYYVLHLNWILLTDVQFNKILVLLLLYVGLTYGESLSETKCINSIYFPFVLSTMPLSLGPALGKKQ